MAAGAGAVTGLLRSELRKVFSTRLWWALLVPVLALSALINLFGSVFAGALAETAAGGSPVPLLLGSLAYALVLTSVFAAVGGIVATAGEFRHRTVTTTYLTAPGRGPVLLAKMAVGGLVGALYAAAAVVIGILAGLVGQGGSAFPDAGPLLAVTLIGIVVVALWAAFGVAVATVISNQVGALVGTLVYLLFAELAVSLLLNDAELRAARGITAYLPGNAGDVALYDIPATVLGDPASSDEIVELLAGVTAPPPWWGALLVLAAWTAAAGGLAWVVGSRRDIT